MSVLGQIRHEKTPERCKTNTFESRAHDNCPDSSPTPSNRHRPQDTSPSPPREPNPSPTLRADSKRWATLNETRHHVGGRSCVSTTSYSSMSMSLPCELCREGRWGGPTASGLDWDASGRPRERVTRLPKSAPIVAASSDASDSELDWRKCEATKWMPLMTFAKVSSLLFAGAGGRASVNEGMVLMSGRKLSMLSSSKSGKLPRPSDSRVSSSAGSVEGRLLGVRMGSGVSCCVCGV